MKVAPGVWLVVVLVLWAIGARPAVVVIGGVVAVVVATVVLAVDLVRGTERLDWSSAAATSTAARSRPTPLTTLLERERRHGSAELRNRLLALVDDRLSAHHGIDRASDPVGAHRLLSPTLVGLTSEPPQKIGSMRTLQRIVTELEAL